MKECGFKKTEILEFTYKKTGELIRFPVGTIYGDEDGPTMVVLGGMHGSEFCGIQAAIDLYNSIQPRMLKGTLIIGMIYNLPAFQNHTGFVVPNDNGNPMSTFPGKADGTFGELMAWHFERRVLSKADYFIELHGGDIPEALAPFVVALATGNAELDAQMEQMALAYNIPLVIHRPIKQDPALGAAYRKAALRGVPSILAESGQQGILDSESTAIHTVGIRNILAHLGMIDAHVVDTVERIHLDSHGGLRSTKTGMWYPCVKLNQIVEKGETVGWIRGYFGELIEEVASPIAGLVNVIRTSPSVLPGSVLIELHAVRKSE